MLVENNVSERKTFSLYCLINISKLLLKYLYLIHFLPNLTISKKLVKLLNKIDFIISKFNTFSLVFKNQAFDRIL